uniref:DUF2452 domain-containing protein n=1 Tax=Syphacia muris TaxID=451379 RepID=A0A0N5AGU9_9BILA
MKDSLESEQLYTVKLYKNDEKVTANLVQPTGTISASASKVESSDIVDLAKKVQEAHDFVQNRAFTRLSAIAEQIKFLRAQAEKALIEAKRDEELHNVACNFQKVPGKIYYLYQQRNGTKFFSMISPEEWGSLNENEFIAAYKLEADRSWTPESEIAKKASEYNNFGDIFLHRKTFSSISS